jgi:DNA repair exonuclease SbcCD ATPase subunit
METIDTRTIEELRLEVDQVRSHAQQIQDEREALIKAFDAVRKEFKGRTWLMEGRGCYPCNDDRYKEEVRYIMDAFNQINSDLWRQIKSKTFEYRNAIEKPLLDKIGEMEETINELEKKVEMLTEMNKGYYDEQP